MGSIFEENLRARRPDLFQFIEGIRKIHKPSGHPELADSFKVCEEIAAEIAPLVVPDAMSFVFGVMQAETLEMYPGQPFLSALEALELWRARRDGTTPRPRILFPVGSSPTTTFAFELGTEENPGGAIYGYTPDGNERLIALDMIGVYAMSLHSLDENGSVDAAKFRANAEIHTPFPLITPRPIPVMFCEKKLVWPQRWVAAEIPSACDLEPKGASLSAATINDATAKLEVIEGRIQGTVQGKEVAAAGVRLSVRDDSGVVAMWASAALPFSDIEDGTRAEFEIMTRGTPNDSRKESDKKIGLSDTVSLAALGVTVNQTLQSGWGLDCSTVVLAIRPL